MKNYIILIIALGVAAYIFGYLMGLSESPVFGAAVTAGLSFIGVLIAVFRGGKEKDERFPMKFIRRSVDYNLIGIFVLVASVSIYFGVDKGIHVKAARKLVAAQSTIEYPILWDSLSAPKSRGEAIDLMSVEILLHRSGFSFKDIKQIFSIKRPTDEYWNDLTFSSQLLMSLTNYKANDSHLMETGLASKMEFDSVVPYVRPKTKTDFHK
ncbi:MAG: hypothetical protein ACJ749_07435 [Flavisolibacter sp.]|jgi:hypothetical protein